MLDPLKLRYLFFVDTYGGVRQAADHLNVSPSTISRQVSNLETDLNLILLEHAGRNVRLTEVGRTLCDYYRNQQSADIQLRARLDEFRNVKRGLIRLSIGEGFAEWIVNEPLRDFQLQYPGIDMEVMVHSTSATVKALLDDEADIGVTYFAPNDRQLKFHARSDVPICAVVHKDHPLTRLGRDPMLADLLIYPIGLLELEFGGRQITDLIARSENVVIRPKLVANSYRILRNFVSLGNGVFIMPYRPSPQREISDDLVPLPLNYVTKVTSQTQIITRMDRHLTNAMRTLLRFLIKSGDFDMSSID
ncbi:MULTISPECIES: LysR family transcriptional regulator [Rhizobium/Agrobacterium group]|uniref:HTH lysR-type domain-containing protein n=1 Tax=Agrobacterium arsenijevicii TaxID=1585697 RepID=A0ABR5DCU5_9HYPH|nr:MULTISPECIES: LysR family transcriptional regulator [unclassified Rhizobium]KJF74871.1 hypothetical protein RP75_02540 [Agrobacterium arsenijevicii]MDH7803889.1 DNA-binding transcriptional LysR family regulator [Rhizobium sp. AN70]